MDLQADLLVSSPAMCDASSTRSGRWSSWACFCRRGSKDEYAQMGLWPGDEHYQRRYHYAREYVNILKLLCTQRDVDYEGELFQLRDCRILPHPNRPLR